MTFIILCIDSKAKLLASYMQYTIVLVTGCQSCIILIQRVAIFPLLADTAVFFLGRTISS